MTTLLLVVSVPIAVAWVLVWAIWGLRDLRGDWKIPEGRSGGS